MAVGKSSLSSIMVAVRVRPFSAEEEELMNEASKYPASFASPASLSKPAMMKKGQLKKIVYALDDHVIAFDPPEESVSLGLQASMSKRTGSGTSKHRDARFAFDRVFNENATQDEVFEGTSRELIDEVLNGFNSTVFAYGATGCGKTHTMCGTQEQPGIIFLTMKELYGRLNSTEGGSKFTASLSYLEVYNETIRDLLSKDQVKPRSLELREDAKQGVVVSGLTEKFPKSVEEMMSIIMQGNKKRTVSATEANATSSRSHAVLQINIRQSYGTPVLSKAYTFATLSFIDLAGSERAASTSNIAMRVTEGVKINVSLLGKTIFLLAYPDPKALGNCIEALAKNNPGDHIPYRGSKLTRLLKFSLGGNCKTVMIVCVSPLNSHFDETLNTLKYADRAKKIKTKIARNTLNVNLHIAQYPNRIKELEALVAQLKKEVALLKERNAENVDSDVTESAKKKQDSLFLELSNQLRSNQESICTRELELRKKTFLLELYKDRISLLQCWLDRSQDNSSITMKQQLSTVPKLQQGLRDKAAALERDITFVNDSISRNFSGLEEKVKAIITEARTSISSHAAGCLEKEREIIICDHDAMYQSFVIETKDTIATLDSESLKRFTDFNAAMLGLKEFIARCKSKELDVSHLENIYLHSIQVFAAVSNNTASVPSVASRSSTPNFLIPAADSTPLKRPYTPLLFSPHHLTADKPRSILSTSNPNPAKRKKVVKIDAISPKAPRKATKPDVTHIKSEPTVVEPELIDKKPPISKPLAGLLPAKKPPAIKPQASVFDRLSGTTRPTSKPRTSLAPKPLIKKSISRVARTGAKPPVQSRSSLPADPRTKTSTPRFRN